MLIALCVYFLLISHLMAGPSNIVLSIKRDNIGVLEETSLIFKEKSIEFINNTNALCPLSEFASLGHYQIVSDSRYKKQKTIFLKLKKKIFGHGAGKTSNNFSPHGFRYFIAGRDVSSDKTYSNMVRYLLEDYCFESQNWKGLDAVFIRQKTNLKKQNFLLLEYFKNKKKIKTEVKSLKELGCTSSNFKKIKGSYAKREKKIYTCSIPLYGQVRLIQHFGKNK